MTKEDFIKIPIEDKISGNSIGVCLKYNPGLWTGSGFEDHPPVHFDNAENMEDLTSLVDSMSINEYKTIITAGMFLNPARTQRALGVFIEAKKYVNKIKKSKKLKI